MMFEAIGAPAVRISVPVSPATPAVNPAVPVAPVPPAAPSAAPAIRINKPGLSVARPAAAPVAVVAAAAPPPVPTASPIQGGIAPRDMGVLFCRFHKTIHAHFHCDACQKSYCDLCVNTRQEADHLAHTCRSCGNVCVPLALKKPKTTGKRGFFASLPGAFIYPLKGTGILIIIVSALVFTGLNILAGRGLFGLLFTVIALGYLYSYSQNIIHATAAEEKNMPDMPGFDDLFGGCFRLAACVLLSFGLPIGLAIAKFFEEDIPWFVISLLGILGCLYFPMCFLAVAMKDTVAAANPLFVVPSILKVPLEYIAAVLVFTAVFGIRMLGSLTSAFAADMSETTHDMNMLLVSFGIRIIWIFVSVYLLTVSMRVLGLLYLTKKYTLGWFPR